MVICVICHFTRVMWPIGLVFKINIFITGRGKCFKNHKKRFTLFFIKIIPVLSFVFSENHASLLYS